jgi:hypothetical protein
MSEHTPGPWKVRDRFKVYAGSYYVGTTQAYGGLPEHIMAQDEANARLIVHAVNCHDEMLAAIRVARGALVSISDSLGYGHPADFTDAIAIDAMQTLNSVIAKAEDV